MELGGERGRWASAGLAPSWAWRLAPFCFATRGYVGETERTLGEAFSLRGMNEIARPRSDRPSTSRSGTRTAHDASGFTVEVSGDELAVSLFGHLTLNWLGQLGAALSRRSIAIVDVDAARDASGRWRAIVHVRAPRASEAAHLDYFALAGEGAPDSSDPARPRLEHFELTRLASGMLELRVQGKDELGFLSALFARLAFLGLFADRVHATTRADRIDDVLTLRGVGGIAPSEASEKALASTLARLSGLSSRPPRSR